MTAGYFKVSGINCQDGQVTHSVSDDDLMMMMMMWDLNAADVLSCRSDTDSTQRPPKATTAFDREQIAGTRSRRFGNGKSNKAASQSLVNLGGGDSSVVRAPDSWLKGRGFESLLERRENFLLQGRLSVLTLISVSVPPPCYRSST